MRIHLLISIVAFSLVGCGPQGRDEQQALDDTGALESEVQAVLSADEGRRLINQARAEARDVTDPAKKMAMVAKALREAGTRVAPGDVISVLYDFMPYASLETFEPARAAGVWKRAVPTDRRQLNAFFDMMAFKFREAATDPHTGQVSSGQHAASVRAFMSTAIGLIKRTEPARMTDQDILSNLVTISYPLSIAGTEFVAALKAAGLTTAPVGRGLDFGSWLNVMALDATLGSETGLPSSSPFHDLTSDSSFEATVLAKTAQSFITYRSQWSDLSSSTMPVGDQLNRVAKATGREPEVALRVLKKTLTADEFAAMQCLRETRRF